MDGVMLPGNATNTEPPNAVLAKAAERVVCPLPFTNSRQHTLTQQQPGVKAVCCKQCSRSAMQ